MPMISRYAVVLMLTALLLLWYAILWLISLTGWRAACVGSSTVCVCSLTRSMPVADGTPRVRGPRLPQAQQKACPASLYYDP